MIPSFSMRKLVYFVAFCIASVLAQDSCPPVQMTATCSGGNVGQVESPVKWKRLDDEFCTFIYRDICYRIIGRELGGSNFKHSDAKSDCRSLGGKLAPILNKEHYGMVWDAARQLHTGTMWIWLGMYYVNGHVQLEDGTTAPYVRWHSGFPKTVAERTKMGMRVEDGPAQHMFNDPPHFTIPNALCQFTFRPM